MAAKKRLARFAQRLTGMPYTTAHSLVYQGAINWHQPVPDAATPVQRDLETRLTYALIEGFDEDPALLGRALGIDAVLPTASGLDIIPGPGLAERVMYTLLPRYDPDFGGVRGPIGVRVARIDPGWWTLYDLWGTGTARVAASWNINPYICPDPRYPNAPVRRAISRPNPTREELRDRRHEQRIAKQEGAGWLAHRNLMMSRLLRRPHLTHCVAQTCGAANIYHHGQLDVVFEWCCGPNPTEFAALAMRSGVMVPVADLGLPPVAERDGYWVARGALPVGKAVLIYRQNQYSAHRDVA